MDKQETRRPKKTQLSGEKKILHKSENGFIMNTQNIIPLDGSCYEAIHSLISQNIFQYLRMFSMQYIKNMTAEDNTKRMNITNFVNIYANIYTYIIFDKNDSK